MQQYEGQGPALLYCIALVMHGQVWAQGVAHLPNMRPNEMNLNLSFNRLVTPAASPNFVAPAGTRLGYRGLSQTFSDRANDDRRWPPCADVRAKVSFSVQIKVLAKSPLKAARFKEVQRELMEWSAQDTRQ
jgi:hypothetical protein